MGRRIARIPKERRKERDCQQGWSSKLVDVLRAYLRRNTIRTSKGGYRGRRKIRVKWRGWLPNPPIHQSYASHQWRYCFKFVAQPLSRGWRGARCVHPERLAEGERGYEVLSSLSLVRCTTSSRRKTSRVASRAWNLIQWIRWREICRKNLLPPQFFNAILLSCSFTYFQTLKFERTHRFRFKDNQLNNLIYIGRYLNCIVFRNYNPIYTASGGLYYVWSILRYVRSKLFCHKSRHDYD